MTTATTATATEPDVTLGIITWNAKGLMKQLLDSIREHVMAHVSATVIKQTALKNGLKTLRMDGARKVLEGASTIEEVLRVTQMDMF